MVIISATSASNVASVEREGVTVTKAKDANVYGPGFRSSFLTVTTHRSYIRRPIFCRKKLLWYFEGLKKMFTIKTLPESSTCSWPVVFREEEFFVMNPWL